MGGGLRSGDRNKINKLIKKLRFLICVTPGSLDVIREVKIGRKLMSGQVRIVPRTVFLVS